MNLIASNQMTLTNVNDGQPIKDNLFSSSNFALTKYVHPTDPTELVSWKYNGKPNTKYTLSTDVPKNIQGTYNVFFDSYPSTPSSFSNPNGVAINNPRTITTDATGMIEITVRIGSTADGIIAKTNRVKLEENDTVTAFVFHPDDQIGQDGADGKTTYIHFAYADDDKGTNFSLTDKNQQYQGYYSDYTEADSTDYRKYKWVDRLANVKVGGVNLLRNSKPFTGANITGSGTLLSENYQGCAVRHLKVTGEVAIAEFRNCVYPKLGGEYVASFWAKGSGALRIYFYGDNGYLQVASGLTSEGDAETRGDGVFDFDLADDWKRYWVKYKLKTAPSSATSVGKHLFFTTSPNGSENEVYLAGAQLEEGNIPTPYTQSPEDIQDQIDDKADQALTQDQLNALAEKNSLIQAEMEAKASMDTVNQWITAYQNYVNANDADKKKSEQALQDASNRLLQIKYDVNDLKQQWNFIDTYMSVQNEGLIIGKKDGSAYAKFSNDRISLFSGNSEVMYISQGTLNIANGIFTKTIQIGRFRFETHPADADMLVVRFLGG